MPRLPSRLASHPMPNNIHPHVFRTLCSTTYADQPTQYIGLSRHQKIMSIHMNLPVLRSLYSSPSLRNSIIVRLLHVDLPGCGSSRVYRRTGDWLSSRFLLYRRWCSQRWAIRTRRLLPADVSCPVLLPEVELCGTASLVRCPGLGRCR